LAIRAVIFDYGMVLSNPQDPVAHRNLMAITGLTPENFERLYWRYRHDYDLGVLNGRSYWAKLAEDAGRTFSPDQIDTLIENDVLMWASLNERMLAWAAALQDAGLATAILSNMGADLLRYMRQEFAWLGHFNHHTWSCELGIAKPDPAIYTWTCAELGVRPDEALFLDDKPENIRAAEAVGLHAIQFHTIEQLHADLASRSLLRDFPQPISA
jgi:putative hydrolase of the HAD superfamily